MTPENLIEVYGKDAANAIHTALNDHMYSDEPTLPVELDSEVYVFEFRPALASIEEYFGTADLF